METVSFILDGIIQMTTQPGEDGNLPGMAGGGKF